ncbi:MAG TPA: AraC family transcriptional regulator [Chitinophagaceae bacterium]|jgi:AraC-like DNA-binding protein|nr:AraC family transcriptional regulator [Chitinophagaceae bacterium]
MVTLSNGQFFGQTNITTDISGITLTDTEYTHDRVDWHYHENAYFTLMLQGRMIEGNKKETYQCPQGTLLFHNWQDAHYNIKPEGFTRGFHVEISPGWCRAQDFDFELLQGSRMLHHPDGLAAAYNLFIESRINDGNSRLAIQVTLLRLLAQLSGRGEEPGRDVPPWVVRLREIVQDTGLDGWTLAALAQTLGIHPVHLSRGFPRYFGAGLGAYARSVKVERARALLGRPELSLTGIAYDCGFADQSHFIRCFKAVHRIPPSRFRQLLEK